MPLIIRDPAIAASHGKRSTALAELLDVYPTLVELAGISLPAGEVLDGVSLGSILKGFGKNASAAAAAAGDGPRGWALSQYPRCPSSANPADFYKDNKCEFVERSLIPYMGYSLRVDGWRYTEWATWDGANLRPIWDKLVGVELYSHDVDEGSTCNSKENGCFDGFENVNLYTTHPDVAANLSTQLHAIVAQRRPNPEGERPYAP